MSLERDLQISFDKTVHGDLYAVITRFRSRSKPSIIIGVEDSLLTQIVDICDKLNNSIDENEENLKKQFKEEIEDERKY